MKNYSNMKKILFYTKANNLKAFNYFSILKENIEKQGKSIFNRYKYKCILNISCDLLEGQMQNRFMLNKSFVFNLFK